MSKKPASKIITSPYNFAPLPNEVVFPDWSGNVSHDIPFRDGISGSFEIEVEAKTPIYVRSGEEQEKEIKGENVRKGSSEFFALGDGRNYAIPGTSLKGVVRSVLSVATFSKMDPVHDSLFSFRDLSNARNEYLRTFNNAKNQGKIHAGWILERGDDWMLYPCPMARVRQGDVERQLNVYNFERSAANATAEEKYKLYSKKYGNEPGSKRVFFSTTRDKQGNQVTQSLQSAVGATQLPKGMHYGELVFTGNPNRTKKKDFVFGVLGKKTPGFALDKQLVSNFLETHETDGEPVESWNYWKSKLRSRVPVPVFWIADNNDRPTRFGLSMLFRLPYHNTVGDILKKRKGNDSSEPDFVETLMGRVDDGRKDYDCLKGRVSIEPLSAEGNPISTGKVTTVLGGPKPTFFPNYIEQKNKDHSSIGKVIKEDGKRGLQKYSTYNSDDTQVRGWKRFPVRKDGSTPDNPRALTDAVATEFEPLPAGTVFRGTVRVHNLRPVELGALLWVLTWGNNPSLRHSVGMAKPLGYGSVQIRLNGDLSASLQSNENKPVDANALVNEFEQYMEQQSSNWKSSKTITELLAMADPEKSAHPSLLQYPTLTTEPAVNHFHEHKNAGNYLLPYSQLRAQRPA